MVLRLLVSQRRGSKSTATCHEDPVALHPAETEVSTDFGQVNLTDQITVRRKDMYPVVSFFDTAGTGPGITVEVAKDGV